MRRTALLTAIAAAPSVMLGALVSCGGESRSTATFCAELRTSTELLTDTADPAALVETYRRLDSRAPLRIKDQWNEVTVLLGRIVSFDPNDPDATQEIIADALRARTAMEDIAEWADSTCKVTLARPTATVAPSDTVALTEVPDTAPDASANGVSAGDNETETTPFDP